VFQAKISAAVLAVVVAMVGFSYFVAAADVEQGILQDEVSDLSTARRSTTSTQRIANAALTAQAEEIATDPKVESELARLRQMALDIGGIEPLKKQSNRLPLFQHLLEWRQQFGMDLEAAYGEPRSDAQSIEQALTTRPARDAWGRPDLVLLKGDRVAQVLAVHAEEGLELTPALDHSENIPLLTEAMDGTTSGFIHWTIHEFFVAVSPVHDDSGNVIGTIAVGYQLDSGFVERLSSITGEGIDVVISSDQRLYASTDLEYRDEILGATFHPVADDGTEVDEGTEVDYESLESGETYVASMNDRRHLVQAHTWQPGEDPAPRIGFLVISDLSQAMNPVDDLKMQILLFGAVILLIGLVLTAIFVRRFLRPLEDVAVGIQEILAGNRDYIFRARPGNPLQGELVNSLNQLTAYLQGRAAPGEAEQQWDEMLVDLEPERPSIYGMQAVKVVTDDEEREELRELYDEYMTRRKELDQHVDMDFDRFCRRIKRNENSLKEKHGASSVDFSVAVSDGKVVLKPKLQFD